MKLQTRFRGLLKVIVLVVLGLVPLVWFLNRPGILIDGIDTNFPLDPTVWFTRRFFVWNDVTNGGNDFSSSLAGIFFHAIQAIPYSLKIPIQGVEIFSLIFWFSAIVGSAYFLARVLLPKKILAQLLLVVFYSFNIFMFNGWENVKVSTLSLVAALPVALAILILIERKAITWQRAGLLTGIVAVILSGSGINPAYFICFFMVIGLFTLGQMISQPTKSYSLDRLKDLAIFSTIIICVNIFWILPSGYFIFKNIPESGSINQIGFTNWVDSLSENTSLFNVIRMQGAWDWYSFDSSSGLPLYIPYALNYFYKWPFLLFSFLIPAIVITTFLFRDSKYRAAYIGFGLMLIVGIFLGAGTHDPTGGLFRFLANHLPFFTLFRSPWYIFTPLLTISYAVLIALLFASLDNKFSNSKSIILTINTLAICLIVGNLVYCYPLVTGKIFRPSSPSGFYVKFPDYLLPSKDWLEKNLNGRVIGYPDDEIEQFDWGYRGVESVLSLFSKKEVLYSPLNMPDSPIASLIKEFYLDLKKGEIESARNLARALDVNQIFDKGDQSSLAPPLPDSMKIGANVFGKWSFYQLPDQGQKIETATKLVLPNSLSDGPKIIGLLNRNQVIVDGNDSITKQIPELDNFNNNIVVAKNSQTDDLNYANSPNSNSLFQLKDPSKIVYTFELASYGNFQPVLERYGLDSFGIRLDQPLKAELDGQHTLLEVGSANDSYVYFKPLNLRPGKHNLTLTLSNQNLVDQLTSGHGPFTTGIDEEGPYLEIFNQSPQDTEVKYDIKSFDPVADYLIQLRYRQIYGNTASVLVSQKNQHSLIKSQARSLPDYPQWNNASFYFEPVRTISTAQVDLEGQSTKDPLGTKIYYKNLSIYKVFANSLIFIQDSKDNLPVANVDYQMVSPVEYQAKINGQGGPSIIVFNENYSPNWQLSAYDSLGNKLGPPLHFSANLYANAWYLANVPPNYRVEIYYQPQKLYYLGILVSGLSILALVAWFFGRH